MSEDTSNNLNIKYLLIGDIDTNKLITEYSTNLISSKEKKNANQIFSRICKSNERRFEERNKITAKENNYFFTLFQPNIVFIVFCPESLPERIVFSLIDEIRSEGILGMINEETKELDPSGRQSLKKIIEKYQIRENVDKIAAIQEDVNAIKMNVRENIDNMVQNVEDVEKLEAKSNELKEASKDYQEKSEEIKRITCWQNFKLWIILILIILLLGGIIVLMVFK